MDLNPPFTQKSLMETAAGIKVLLMDVDGVLTDGKLYLVPDSAGEMVETKGFTAQDGIALRWLTWYGIRTGVISGRNSPATGERARQVGMSWVQQGHIEKIPVFEEIVRDAGVSASEVAYVGDDLTDVVLFRRAGLAIATANARQEVKRAAHAVTETRGGEGAVREVIELLLSAKGVWDELLRKYEVIV
jgi:3-deoxy-D-manno-octulosonate 8-phosphate phosphatase (KDO 8-P phosphatase)